MKHALPRAFVAQSDEPGGRPRPLERRTALIYCAVLLLLLAACWCLWPGVSGPRGSVTFSSTLRAEPPQLDCFSRPAVAVAILEREVDRTVAN